MSGLRDGRPGVSALGSRAGRGRVAMSMTVFDSAYPAPKPVIGLTPPVIGRGLERVWAPDWGAAVGAVKRGGLLTGEPRPRR